MPPPLTPSRVMHSTKVWVVRVALVITEILALQHFSTNRYDVLHVEADSYGRFFLLTPIVIRAAIVSGATTAGIHLVKSYRPHLRLLRRYTPNIQAWAFNGGFLLLILIITSNLASPAPSLNEFSLSHTALAWGGMLLSWASILVVKIRRMSPTHMPGTYGAEWL
jgi:hypothetical protein